MWPAIQLVTSGLALAAFIWAGAVTLIRIRLKERERLILAASEQDRVILVQEALESFHVDAKRLPLKDQTQLVLERMRGDLQRFRIKAIVVSLLAVLFAAVTLTAIFIATPASGSVADTNNQSQKERCNVPIDKKPLDCPLR